MKEYYYNLQLQYANMSDEGHELLHFKCKKVAKGTSHCIGRFHNLIYDKDKMEFMNLPIALMSDEKILIFVAETEREMMEISQSAY